MNATIAGLDLASDAAPERLLRHSCRPRFCVQDDQGIERRKGPILASRTSIRLKNLRLRCALRGKLQIKLARGHEVAFLPSSRHSRVHRQCAPKTRHLL
jgi:hypothetical protein